ncbi:20599_t:CDS:2 [Funneliformis geosporum]|uniref:18680_t:CDS:1 n=1 Tax=Funneliformis geosporum TaxID=1117311 RepID=A0A9W4WV22_9GLOM|nr:18680_t:CDS:2 [Funneliformis geosporum]CAI2176038.1 20599_t:CDS:2 [Funneliformis geosporum]
MDVNSSTLRKILQVEMLDQTQRTSQINMLLKKKKQDVVNISLPADKLDMNKVDLCVLEAIHEPYNAERIGKDLTYLSNNGIGVVGGNEFRPDVGVVIKSQLLVNDRDRALFKIDLIQQHRVRVEYVGIAIPDLTNSFLPNPNPLNPTNHATPETNRTDRPARAPYVIHSLGRKQLSSLL